MIQLEVGKRYFNRLGEERGPLERTPTWSSFYKTHPFFCRRHNETYKSDGSYRPTGVVSESDKDLVSEISVHADYDHLGDLQREHNEMQNKLAATMLCNVRMFGKTDDDKRRPSLLFWEKRLGIKRPQTDDNTARDEKEQACWESLREPGSLDVVGTEFWENYFNFKDSNPKDSIGCTKPPLHTVPTGPLFEAGAVLLHGHCKYRGYNWRVAGVRSSIYYDAVMRHLMAWWEGEDTDPDSGLPHIAHAIAGLCVLRDSQMIGNCTDDRPPRRQHPFNALRQLVAEMAQKPQPEPYTEQNTAQVKP